LLAEILLVDGANSAIDSDLLDGQQGTYYADIPSRLGYAPVNKTGDTMSGTLVLANTTPTINLHSTGSNSSFTIKNVAGDLVIANTNAISRPLVFDTANTVAITTLTATLIHQFDKTTFRSAKYVVNAINNNANTQSVSELLVLHNIVDAMVTEYAQLNSNGAFLTISANTDGTNVKVYGTSSSNNATVKFNAIMM
jgi:hypothetical protein